MAKRIGPRMAQVAHIVASEPGIVALRVADQVAPGQHKRDRGYGYRTVHRAINAGIIQMKRRKNRMYLYPNK